MRGKVRDSFFFFWSSFLKKKREEWQTFLVFVLGEEAYKLDDFVEPEHLRALGSAELTPCLRRAQRGG